MLAKEYRLHAEAKLPWDNVNYIILVPAQAHKPGFETEQTLQGSNVKK